MRPLLNLIIKSQKINCGGKGGGEASEDETNGNICITHFWAIKLCAAKKKLACGPCIMHDLVNFKLYWFLPSLS
jgi:hypothetical protein